MKMGSSLLTVQEGWGPFALEISPHPLDSWVTRVIVIFIDIIMYVKSDYDGGWCDVY